MDDRAQTIDALVSSRGIDTVFAELEEWLTANGVEIDTRYE